MNEHPDDDLRRLAVKRIEERRGFSTHVVTYLVFNLVLVGIWATTGQGYFWPGWVAGGWGAAVLLHAWTAFVQRPITGEDIDREIQRLGGRRPRGA